MALASLLSRGRIGVVESLFSFVPVEWLVTIPLYRVVYANDSVEPNRFSPFGAK
jgi:hypothetical protein